MISAPLIHQYRTASGPFSIQWQQFFILWSPVSSDCAGSNTVSPLSSLLLLKL